MRYTVMDDNNRPGEAMRACLEKKIPFTLVEPGDCSLVLTEPTKEVINDFIRGGWEVRDQHGNLCEIREEESA